MTIPVPVPVSQFPAASLPLVGNELFPLVQDGVTKVTEIDDVASSLTGRLTPESAFALPSGTTNNLDRAGAIRLLLGTAAGNSTVTGFQGGVNGQLLIVTNTGPNLLTLGVETLSAPTNQIYGPAAITLPAKMSQILCYSAILSKWVIS